MKRFLLILLTCSLILTGCSSITNKNSSKDSSIVVYYVKGHPFYENAITAYRKSNPNTELKAVEFDSEDTLAQKYSAEVSIGEGPDVLLLTDTSKIDYLKSSNGDNYLDLTLLLQQDKSYNKDNYFEIVMEAGKINNRQYALPITFDLGLVHIRDQALEEMDNPELVGLNFNDFSQKVMEYQNKLSNSDGIKVVLLLSFNPTVSNLINMSRIAGTNLIDVDQESVAINKEELLNLCDFTKAGQSELFNKMDEIQGLGANFSYYTGFILSRGNIPLLARQGEITTEVNANQTISVFGLPCYKEKNFHATIKDYGVVSSKSKNPEESYAFLRYLMDFSLEARSDQVGNPINRKVFSYQLETLRKQNKAYVGNTTLTINQMKEENYNSISEMMNKISSASMVYSDVEEILESTMSAYINDKDSFDNCYEQLVNRLELYLKE